MPLDLKIFFNSDVAACKACIAPLLSTALDKANEFWPVSILLPITSTWEAKFLKIIFRMAVLIHLSRCPKDSNAIKSKNCESAMPTKISLSKIPMKLQIIFSGEDFSKTCRYFLDKKIVETAKSSHFSGS